uniref:Arylformamidase n=2 Tax=Bos TaxID=9903 RepID=A0A4W2HCY9_BOBOX
MQLMAPSGSWQTRHSAPLPPPCRLPPVPAQGMLSRRAGQSEAGAAIPEPITARPRDWREIWPQPAPSWEGPETRVPGSVPGRWAWLLPDGAWSVTREVSVVHQGLVGALPTCYKKAGSRAHAVHVALWYMCVWWYKAGMDVSGGNHRHEAPWKRMSKEELDNQYSPSRWVVRLGAEEAMRTYSQIGNEVTKRARATGRSLLNVPYGDGDGEKLDIYLPEAVSEAMPFLVFFHGGYWQSGREDAQRNSPLWQLETAPTQPADPACRILVTVGQHDSPEFHRQSREFYQTLCQGGWKASFEELHDMDHFEILWNLTQEDYVLTQIILKTIFQES